MTREVKIVRSANEIERAHDILFSVVCVRKLRNAVFAQDPDKETSIKCMKAAADVLCWLLGHTHSNFEENMSGLEEVLVGLGCELRDADNPVWLEEEQDGPIPG